MKPLAADEIRGMWGTVLLPLDEEERIEFDRLQLELDALVRSGLRGVYTNGTSGEFAAQTEDEFLEVSRMVAETCRSARVPFQIGATHLNPRACLDRLAKTRQLEPSAFQLALPDWLPPSREESIDFLRRAAQVAEGIGLVLYVPGHAKQKLDPTDIANLKAEVPELIGVKIPDGNSSWYGAVRRDLEGVAVFVPGHHAATGMLNGAQGSYSNVACLSPAGTARWEGLIHSDPMRALELERRIVDFFQVHIAPFAGQGFSPVAIDKFLAALGGWAPVGVKVRWPYRSIPAADVERLSGGARTVLPELFAG